MNFVRASAVRPRFNARTRVRNQESAEPGRVAEIEVLRAVAIIMVLIEHIPFNLLFWSSWVTGLIFNSLGLWTGVDLFFAISGFVIARSLLPRLENITDRTAFFRVAIAFWLRRAWRLLPSAWFWLTAPLVLCLVFNTSQSYGTLRDNYDMFVAGILNLANFHEAIFFGKHGSGTAFVQWSLALEEQFYLLLPLAAFVFRRYLVVPLLLLFAFSFVSPDTPVFMMLRAGPVALGVLLAIWSRHATYQDCAPAIFGRHRILRIAALCLGIVFICSLASATLYIVPFYLGPIAILCAALVWLASYDRGYLWRPGASRRVMEIIAARSYSLYLVHVPVYFGMHEMWFRLYGMANPTRGQAVAYFIFAYTLVAGLAELNHRLLEAPLRERGKIIAANFAARHAVAPS
jgi:peptidoglycan/LPS O-acetylase OafA/YrhL